MASRDLIEITMSLCAAQQQAHGNVRLDLDMSLRDVLALLAPNHIRFVYQPPKEKPRD